jgi:hypothetical protein
MALVVVAVAAVFSAVLALELKPHHRAQTCICEVNEDISALRDALLSDAVLLGALDDPRPLGPGLRLIPRFRDAADPVDALRRSLAFEPAPVTPQSAVMLVTRADSATEGIEIVAAVAASCSKRLGAQRIVSALPFAHREADAIAGEVFLISSLAEIFVISLCVLFQRRREKAKLQAEAPGQGRTEDPVDLDQVADLGHVFAIRRMTESPVSDSGGSVEPTSPDRR